MSTISKAIRCSTNDVICQGDVFKNVKYSYIDSEDEKGVNIIELEFPCAIIVSQACDVISMSQLQESKQGKPSKYMPSILLCPIYDESMVKTTEHLSQVFQNNSISIEPERIMQKDDLEVAKRDWHYRFHHLKIIDNGNKNNVLMENAIIDFKHYFTVPVKNLLENRDKRIFKLDDLFAEQITLKFCTYLSRVAIP